jgi:Tfp pilus assembly protein PilN
MIQFNLLPDVKKEYLKAKRTKRLTITVATFASVVSLVIVGVLWSVIQFTQNNHINNLTSDIEERASEVSSIEDINTILTVQNQLEQLPQLHEQKPETSRLFDYLSALIPEEAPLSQLNMSIDDESISIQGTADSLATINKVVDTFKSVTYTIDGEEGGEAFTVISSDGTATDESATYSITMDFDTTIFDNTLDIALFVNGEPANISADDSGEES